MLSSCARFGIGGGSSDATSATNQSPAATAVGEQNRYAALKDLVNDEIRSANASINERRDRVVKMEPYFFKAYESYPGDGSLADIDIRETESRTARYVADVTLDKQRYMTRLHRKKDAARADSNFVRGTGIEKQTYQFRNGRWICIGTLFVADKIEENVNGEWVPVKQELERGIDSEEDDASWFSRAWSNMTGR